VGTPNDGTQQPAATSSAAESTELVEAAGRFRVYLGAAAGVGKTMAMLSEGQRRKERGTDVAIGFVECHDRPRTEELIEGLELIPRRAVEYRGARFEEMDLDALLARHPGLVLVDELAHTNVVGSGRHEKRWQDVIECLDAGIDVVTTVNIQHLESIADAVERITQVHIGERVPDWVLRRADQIELVDSSPEQLRRRLLHGNIYPPEKVPQALANFFRTDNLIALRELALRFLADETDVKLLNHPRWRQSPDLWETSERLLVGVTTAPGTEAIVRRASRMAARIKADLQVLHVVVGDRARPSEHDQLVVLRQLAADVGAEWHEIRADDPSQALIDFARSHQITQIVVGSSARSRRQELLHGGSFVRKVSRLAAHSAIDVHIIARRDGVVGSTERVDGADES
jgi:two-component system, OmpR family, sensor histidine kinase KdpD